MGDCRAARVPTIPAAFVRVGGVLARDECGDLIESETCLAEVADLPGDEAE